MLSLRAKIGQMLIMGFNGHDETQTLPVFQWLEKEGLGGVLLFDYCLKTKSYDKNLINQIQIKRLINRLNASNAKGEAKDKNPLWVAVDFEGGAVDRFSQIPGCLKTTSASHWLSWPVSKIIEEAQKMATQLRTLGFNLNFAPVVDLALNNQQGIIGKLQRSFSDNPFEVARLAGLWVDAFQANGITSCYKHFPGHGSAMGDTHLGFVDVTETFHDSELTPYHQLVKNGADSLMIMTAHVINKNLDETGIPATLSYPILTQLLRQQLGFKGIIISDDLQMQAISEHYSLEQALTLTINAGADMVIIGNQLGYIEGPAVIDIIEQLVQRNVIALSRIEAAYERITQVKRMLYIEPIDALDLCVKISAT